MDRIINIKVGGNYLTKDNKNAGVKGEANVTRLRITFDEGWDNYAKKVTFWDARGANPVARTLTTDLIENIATDSRTYIVPIPSEPMTVSGKMTFVIDGYADGKRQRSFSDELMVNDAPIDDNAGEAQDPTPTQAEQLQGQIESIFDTIHEAAVSKIDAEAAANSAQAAQAAAESAQQAAGLSEANAEVAKAEAIAATDIAVSASAAAKEARDDIVNMTVSSERLDANEAPFVDKTEKNGVVNLHFGMPEGEKGDTGNSGVHTGSDEPTDPDQYVWIEETAGADYLGGVYIGDEVPADPCINAWIKTNGSTDDTVLKIKNELGQWIDIETVMGASAYEVAVGSGFSGTEAEWLDSLKGEKGDKGDRGDRGLQGIQGPRGYSGLVPLVKETATSGEIIVNPNEHKLFENALTGETTVTLASALDGWDNEWAFTIRQGETAQTLILPEIEWDRGFAPTFGANTVTEVRLHYKYDILKGVWL